MEKIAVETAHTLQTPNGVLKAMNTCWYLPACRYIVLTSGSLYSLSVLMRRQ